MPIDYAKRRPVSRLRREEKKRALRTSLVFLLALGAFGFLFIIFGINLIAKFSLLISRLRTSKPTIVNQDTIPPTAPQLSSPVTATSSALISINGYAEPQSLVKLYVNGTKTNELQVPDSGEISFPEVILVEGLNNLYAIASDSSNNESARSDTVTVIVDDSGPTLTLDQPKDGAIFYGPTERLITISGKTDADANITLNGKILVISPDGSFTSQYELQEGNNPLNFVAADAANNQTITDLSVTYSP